MNAPEELKQDIHRILRETVSSIYAGSIQDEIGDAIAEDVMECSAYHDEDIWNEDDIRLAIGRVLIERLGIQQ